MLVCVDGTWSRPGVRWCVDWPQAGTSAAIVSDSFCRSLTVICSSCQHPEVALSDASDSESTASESEEDCSMQPSSSSSSSSSLKVKKEKPQLDLHSILDRCLQRQAEASAASVASRPANDPAAMTILEFNRELQTIESAGFSGDTIAALTACSAKPDCVRQRNHSSPEIRC